MADSLGIRLGIEGERDFKNALRDINQSFKLLGSEMTLVASQFDKNEKSVQSLTARNTVLNKEIDTQREKITTLQAALQNASDSFGENDKRTQAWQIQLNNAQAELNSMERELARNNTALDQAADGFGDAEDQAGEFGDGIKDTAAKAEDAGGRFEKLGGILKGIGVALGAVVVAAGAAAIKLGKDVVAQFGELEQNLGGSEAVFQGYADHMRKIGEDAYKNMGVTQSQYLATANRMGALFQGSGLDVQKSAELSAKAMQRAADMASVMGIDMQMALESVAGAAKGNFTMMDNLGVAMNATSIQAYTVSKGLDFVWASASQAEKAEVAMQMFFDSTEQYAGYFARESTQTITGSIGLLKAAVGSFTAGLGNAGADMTNLTGNVVEAFRSVVTNIIPILQNIVAALPEVLGAILPALTALLPDMLGAGVQIVQSLLTGLIQSLPAITQGAIQLMVGLVQGIIQNLPALVTAGAQAVIQLAKGLAEAIPALIPAAINAVQTVIATLISLLPELVMAGAEMMGKLAEGLGNAIPLLKPVTMAISGIMDVLKALAPFLVAAAAGFAAFQIVSMITGMISGMTVATTAHTIATAAQTVATYAVTAAQWLWNAAMTANPIGLIIAGVAALAAGIAVLIGWFNRESEEQKRLKEQTKALIEENDQLNQSIEETSAAYEERQSAIANESGAAASLADKIAALSAVENKSAKQKEELAAYVGMLNEAMGESVVSYNAETDSMSRNIDEIYGLVEARKAEAKAQAARERAVEIAKEQMEVEDQLNKIEQQRIELGAAMAEGTIKKGFYNDEIKKLSESEAELIVRQDDLIVSFDSATQAVTEAAAAQMAANEMMTGSANAATDAMAEANAIQEELAQKRTEREQAVTDAMIQAASEQGLTLDEYKAKLQQTQQEEEAAYKKREETLTKYTATATEMFNRLNNKSDITVSQMTANMRHNQQVMETWADNLTALAERGINKGLLERLRSAGPESAGTVAALVKASDKEFSELNSVFENGSKVATDALLKQLGLPDVVGAGADMVDEIAEGVDSNSNLETAAQHLIQDASAAAKSAVSIGGFDAIGRSIVEGVYSGIQARQSWFRSQVSAFFKSIVTSVKSELGIKSPSTVFAGIGENMALGLGAGFGERMNQVARDMQSVIPTGFDTPNFGMSASARGVAGAVGTVIHQSMSVVAPKALSERELAREFRNMSRKMAQI